MRSAAIFVLAVLFASLTLSAQQGAATAGMEALSPLGQTVLVLPPPVLETCPLGMHVRQGTGGQLMQVKDGRRTTVFAARLLLTLTGPTSGHVQSRQKLPAMANSLQIKQAIVTVHGWNGQNRLLRVPSGQSSQELTRTLSVRFASPGENEVSGEIQVAGLTTWTSVDLNSVTYANGETWNFSGSQSCHAVPDPIMLIGAH